MSSSLRGILYTLGGFTCFSLSDILFKYIGSDYSIFILAFWNAFFGLFTVVIVSLFRGGLKKNLRSTNLKMQAVRAVFLVLNFMLFIYGLILLPVAKAYALDFTAPFMTAVLSVFLLKEAIGKHRILAISLGFAGVLVILRPGLIPLDAGSLCIFGAVIALALVNTASRSIGDKEPALAFTFYCDLLMLVCGGIIAVAQGWSWPSGIHFGFLAVAGLLSALGTVFLARGFVLAPASVAAPFHYVQMIWAPLLGWLVFQEIPDVWVALGAMIIVTSGLYLVYQESRVRQQHLPVVHGLERVS